MMPNRHLRFALPAAVCALALLPHLAHAAYIGITDTPGVSTVIDAGDFDGSGGFVANGTTLSHGDGSSGSLTVADTTPIGFTGSWVDDGDTLLATPTIYFVAAPGDTTILAELTYSASNSGSTGTITGTFTDAAAEALGTVPDGTDAADVIVAGSSTGFNLPFSSNGVTVDAVPAVPEPASLALLGAGLLAIAAVTRRRPRAPAGPA